MRPQHPDPFLSLINLLATLKVITYRQAHKAWNNGYNSYSY